MTARTARAVRAARAAQLVEDRARAALVASRERIRALDAAIEDSEARSRALLTQALTPALRGHLVVAGARHRQDQERERNELLEVTHTHHERWKHAQLRVRSLDKLVDRLGAVDALQQGRTDRATWQDLLVAHATGPRIGGQR